MQPKARYLPCLRLRDSGLIILKGGCEDAVSLERVPDSWCHEISNADFIIATAAATVTIMCHLMTGYERCVIRLFHCANIAERTCTT